MMVVGMLSGLPVFANPSPETEKIVSELHNLAARARVIGDDIDKVAKEQAGVDNEDSDLQHTVASRSTWKTFFIGTDYKNLGQLRNNLVTTQNRIAHLTELLTRISDPALKQALETQIKALQDQAAKTDRFITDNQGKFSFLGWFFRQLYR